jgi:hypothetical protein
MMGRGEQVQEHLVRVYKSAETPGRADQLVWKLAAVASDNAALDPDVVGMILNRVIDNAGVAVASLLRHPVANARAQALAHPHAGGSTVFGASRSNLVACEWGAWANGTAVRELDFHDSFLAADMNHPSTLPSLQWRDDQNHRLVVRTRACEVPEPGSFFARLRTCNLWHHFVYHHFGILNRCFL